MNIASYFIFRSQHNLIFNKILTWIIKTDEKIYFICTNIDNRYERILERGITRCRTFLDKWVFIGICSTKYKARQPSTPPYLLSSKPLTFIALPDSPFSCLWRARLLRIFPFTFYSGKQEGILVAVQTRSPIARGNWVDIGNESKEQITRSKGWRALRWSGEPMSGVGTWS